MAGQAARDPSSDRLRSLRILCGLGVGWLAAGWLWEVGLRWPAVATTTTFEPLLARMLATWWAGLAIAVPVTSLLGPFPLLLRWSAPACLACILLLALPPVAWLAGWAPSIVFTMLGAAAVTLTVDTAICRRAAAMPVAPRAVLALAFVVAAAGLPLILPWRGSLGAFAALGSASHAPALLHDFPFGLLAPLTLPGATLGALVIVTRPRPR